MIIVYVHTPVGILHAKFQVSKAFRKSFNNGFRCLNRMWSRPPKLQLDPVAHKLWQRNIVKLGFNSLISLTISTDKLCFGVVSFWQFTMTLAFM